MQVTTCQYRHLSSAEKMLIFIIHILHTPPISKQTGWSCDEVGAKPFWSWQLCFRCFSRENFGIWLNTFLIQLRKGPWFWVTMYYCSDRRNPIITRDGLLSGGTAESASLPKTPYFSVCGADILLPFGFHPCVSTIFFQDVWQRGQCNHPGFCLIIPSVSLFCFTLPNACLQCTSVCSSVFSEVKSTQSKTHPEPFPCCLLAFEVSGIPDFRLW